MLRWQVVCEMVLHREGWKTGILFIMSNGVRREGREVGTRATPAASLRGGTQG